MDQTPKENSVHLQNLTRDRIFYSEASNNMRTLT